MNSFVKQFLQTNKLQQFAVLVFVLCLVCGSVLRCSSASSAESIKTPNSLQAAAPPGASVSTKVQVPASMRSAPFNTDRYLKIPPNFAISVYARVPGARFMAVAPNGDLLVSRPGSGDVKLVRPNPNGDPTISTFVSGLRNPHDIVFHTIGSTSYVYISESNQINRFTYNNGDTTAQNRQIVVANLPDSSSPELQGAYGHQLKNIALDANNKLYVAIASATNASPSDAASNPVRCAIYQYDADGTNGRLFARGLRNAEGLAILPNSTELWVVVNNRDNIAYPFHNDWDGDGTDDYGKIMPSYVDNHPPEPFTRVREGGNYGWPFANPNPDTANGLNDMPFDLDVENNANGQNGAASSFDRITKGIQAHSAPLGLSFLQNTNFPAAYRNGAVVAYHGSWNRTRRTGYKIAYFPWDAARNAPGDEINLVTDWVNDGTQDVWGRPVDAVPDAQGNLLISDDQSGTIYKLTYNSSVIPNGTYRLIAECSGKALDVYGVQLQDGANVIQWQPHGGNNQKWRIENLNNGYYLLIAVHSGKVLDVYGAGQSDGSNVIQWGWHGGDNQQWQIVSVGNGYYKLLPRHAPGKALNVAGASTADGANVQIWSDNGGTAQRWRIESVTP